MLVMMMMMMMMMMIMMMMVNELQCTMWIYIHVILSYCQPSDPVRHTKCPASPANVHHHHTGMRRGGVDGDLRGDPFAGAFSRLPAVGLAGFGALRSRGQGRRHPARHTGGEGSRRL
jgi:hypothetical protein